MGAVSVISTTVFASISTYVFSDDTVTTNNKGATCTYKTYQVFDIIAIN